MPRLQSKSFDHPDSTRDFPNSHAALVEFGDTTVGLARWDPGWRWSNDLRPMVGTSSCLVHHLGYALSGTLHVATDDGQSLDVIGPAVYEIPAGHDAWVVGDVPFVTVEWTSAAVVAAGTEGPDERILASVLFTDIVDSTRRLAEAGDTQWRTMLAAHNRVLRDRLNQFRGREIHTTGDGFLAIFDSPSRAVRCGLAMTEAAEAVGLPIRVGVHTGELELVGGDARGVAVHAAARVLAHAGAGEVVVSATTRALLEGSGLEFEDAGTHELKGLPGSWTLSRVVPNG
ncbi:MAG: adenylate/guanylate cyclase domain-containing protein [Chloroflexota bacterium]